MYLTVILSLSLCFVSLDGTVDGRLTGAAQVPEGRAAGLAVGGAGAGFGVCAGFWSQHRRRGHRPRRTRGPGLHPSGGHHQHAEQHFAEEGRRR